MESFHAGINGRTLTAALTATSQSLTLDSVPADLSAGRYPFKVDLEVLSGSYPGTGTIFGDLARGLDGTIPRAHIAGVKVLHPIRGTTLAALARAAQEASLAQYVRSPAARIFISSNFT